MDWCVVILTIGILVISGISWFQFSKRAMELIKEKNSIGDNEVCRLARTDFTITALAKEYDGNKESEDVQNEIMEQDSRKSIIEHIDYIVDLIDGNWNVAVENKQISGIDSYITYRLLGQISSAQVLKGEDGWLFYKSTSDGDSISDYEGTNIYTQEEYQSISEQIQRVNEYLSRKQISFMIVLCPNKENVYYDKMPKSYYHSLKSRTDDLAEFLTDQKLPVLNLKEKLISSKEIGQLYYKTDTHWNEIGAYIGVQNLLEEWDMSSVSIHNRMIIENRNKYVGDLSLMVDLGDYIFDESTYSIQSNQITSLNTKQTYSQYTNEKANCNKTLLLVGDSFRNAMIPAVTEQFSTVYVVHRNDYQPDLLEQFQPDYVIIEYVERYSSNLLDIEQMVMYQDLLE